MPRKGKLAIVTCIVALFAMMSWISSSGADDEKQPKDDGCGRKVPFPDVKGAEAVRLFRMLHEIATETDPLGTRVTSDWLRQTVLRNRNALVVSLATLRLLRRGEPVADCCDHMRALLASEDMRYTRGEELLKGVLDYVPHHGVPSWELPEGQRRKVGRGPWSFCLLESSELDPATLRRYHEPLFRTGSWDPYAIEDALLKLEGASDYLALRWTAEADPQREAARLLALWEEHQGSDEGMVVLARMSELEPALILLDAWASREFSSEPREHPASGNLRDVLRCNRTRERDVVFALSALDRGRWSRDWFAWYVAMHPYPPLVMDDSSTGTPIDDEVLRSGVPLPLRLYFLFHERGNLDLQHPVVGD